jgi:hypothetical protein
VNLSFVRLKNLGVKIGYCDGSIAIRGLGNASPQSADSRPGRIQFLGYLVVGQTLVPIQLGEQFLHVYFFNHLEFSRVKEGFLKQLTELCYTNVTFVNLHLCKFRSYR